MISTEQCIAVCSISALVVAGEVTGCILLEKRRIAYLEQVAEIKAEKARAPIKVKTVKVETPTRSVFDTQSEDPEEVLVSETISDRVDVVLPNSIDKLGSRFANTRSQRYSIYADMTIVRPGVYDSIALDFYADNTFIFNGYQASGYDIEKMFGRDFVEEVLTLGMGRDAQLLVYSNVRIDNYDHFFKIVVTFHEGGVDMDPDEDIGYDPDDPEFAEAPEEDDEEAIVEAEEAALQEMMDAEEIEAEADFFDREGGTIEFHDTGELTESEIYSGWEGSEWKYNLRTGLLYDENEDPISQEDALEWLGLDVMKVVCTPAVLLSFPSRTVYVRNGKLKIMFEIDIV